MSKYRADTVKEHLRNGVLLRNPVLVQAIGLFPVVAVATSLTSALLFAAVSLVILIIMEVLTNLVLKHFPTWLRVGFYAIFSFIIIIPFIFICEKFFSDKLSPAAVFLPILSVNALISYRCERIAVSSSLKNSFWDAVTTSLGYGAVLLSVGFIRELLGRGSVFGYSIPGFPTISGLLMPFGGFVILGFMAAALRWGMARHYDYEATETAVDHIREEELEEKNGLKNLFGIAKTTDTLKNPSSDTKYTEKKASSLKSDRKAENEAKVKLTAERKQAETQKREARAAANKAAAERNDAQKAERQKAEAERTAKIKAEKEAAARIAEKKRRDEKLAAEKAEKLKKAEAERKLAEDKKRAEEAKLEKQRRLAEAKKRAEEARLEKEKRKAERKAEKEKAKKQKKSIVFKADSKPVSKPSATAKPYYNEDDFDYDIVWAKFKSRQANQDNNNDKGEPNA